MSSKRKIFEVHIPSVLGYEKVAMDSAAAVARIMGFHHSRVEDLKTAVSEACINAIEHGNRLKKNTRVLIALEMGKKSLEVRVEDEGSGPDEKIKVPEIKRQLEKKDDPRGWGIFLIKNLVDEMEFKNMPDGGNVMRMVIRVNR